MKKHINIPLVLIAAVALIVTTVELKRWSAPSKANKDALAALLEKNRALQAQIAALKKPAAPDSQRTTAARGKAREKQLVETINQSLAEYSSALVEHKTNDREFSLKYYAALRSDVDVQCSPFYHLQHLTKEQTDALAEALFQRQLRYDTIKDGRTAGGTVANAKAARAGADAELATAAREALGEDAYAQFSIYERQRGAWDYTSTFAGMLSLADMPLSLEQASRFADALANANAAFQRGEPVDMMEMNTDWDAVNAAAAKFLTPEQLVFLKNVDVSAKGGALGFSPSQQSEAFIRALNPPE